MRINILNLPDLNRRAYFSTAQQDLGIRYHNKFVGFVLSLLGKAVKLQDAQGRTLYLNKNSLYKWLNNSGKPVDTGTQSTDIANKITRVASNFNASSPLPFIKFTKFYGKLEFKEAAESKKNVLYLFGENDLQKQRRAGERGPPSGGQATDLLGNTYDRVSAYGITTTFYGQDVPSLDEFKALMQQEFAPLEAFIEGGGIVIVPWNRQEDHSLLGRGLSNIAKHPNHAAYFAVIENHMHRLQEIAQTAKTSTSDDETARMAFWEKVAQEREAINRAAQENAASVASERDPLINKSINT